MKALVGAFNQEKALVGDFSVIVQPVVEPMDRFAALNLMLSTSSHITLNVRIMQLFCFMFLFAISMVRVT